MRRESLKDVEEKLQSLYDLYSKSADGLLDLSDHLYIEVNNLRRQKKMGRVRIYQHWLKVISDRIIEVKQEALIEICNFGVF